MDQNRHFLYDCFLTVGLMSVVDSNPLGLIPSSLVAPQLRFFLRRAVNLQGADNGRGVGDGIPQGTLRSGVRGLRVWGLGFRGFGFILG